MTSRASPRVTPQRRKALPSAVTVPDNRRFDLFCRKSRPKSASSPYYVRSRFPEKSSLVCWVRRYVIEVFQRYWTRSFIGWQRFSRAGPNRAHQALARLEQLGRLTRTVTQNVDGLHQRAGSRQVTELHGSLTSVGCLGCGAIVGRAAMQLQLRERNPLLADLSAQLAPDGDALLNNFDSNGVNIPDCESCGGILKPQVVFFGESVPRERVAACLETLASADAMLVVGSSLMVYSGFRFVRAAHGAGIPIAAINLGKTRADELLSLKIVQDCSTALNSIL